MSVRRTCVCLCVCVCVRRTCVSAYLSLPPRLCVSPCTWVYATVLHGVDVLFVSFSAGAPDTHAVDPDVEPLVPSSVNDMLSMHMRWRTLVTNGATLSDDDVRHWRGVIDALEAVYKYPVRGGLSPAMTAMLGMAVPRVTNSQTMRVRLRMAIATMQPGLRKMEAARQQEQDRVAAATGVRVNGGRNAVGHYQYMCATTSMPVDCTVYQTRYMENVEELRAAVDEHRTPRSAASRNLNMSGWWETILKTPRRGAALTPPGAARKVVTAAPQPQPQPLPKQKPKPTLVPVPVLVPVPDDNVEEESKRKEDGRKSDGVVREAAPVAPKSSKAAANHVMRELERLKAQHPNSSVMNQLAARLKQTITSAIAAPHPAAP